MSLQKNKAKESNIKFTAKYENINDKKNKKADFFDSVIWHD